MKIQNSILALIVSLSISLVGNTQSKKTIINGKVMNWPTDTVYLQTMTFYSPFSNKLIFQELNRDSTFSFELENSSIPQIVQLYSKKNHAKQNREQLLFLNYTNDYYYYGHCVKFYTYGTSTFLLEPEKVLELEIKANQKLEKLSPEMAKKYQKAGAEILTNNMIAQINETEIRFSGENTFQYEYFQKTFDLEDKIDNRLELYEKQPMEKAIESYTKIRKKLLDNLDAEKGKMSPTYYEYIKAEIEFGSRVEFLKFLMFTKKFDENGLDSLFSKEIPQEINAIVDFDKNGVTPVVMASEAYNKYLELYLNFKVNVQNKKFSAFNEFSKQKCKTAIRELPMQSAYYYIAGQLLEKERTEDFAESLLIETIKQFPNGELNEQLREKYDL